MAAVVYFSSVSNNTHRFVTRLHVEELGMRTLRIPLRPRDPALALDEPYVLVVPTYGGGNDHGAVPKQVIRFLNDPENRRWIRGVIATGNTNFGKAYCLAGDIISAKCHVPYLYSLELLGTPEDVAAMREGLRQFFAEPARVTAGAGSPSP